MSRLYAASTTVEAIEARIKKVEEQMSKGVKKLICICRCHEAQQVDDLFDSCDQCVDNHY